MSEQDLKKLIVLDIIDQEEQLKYLERQKAGYVVSSRGTVSAYSFENRSWGRKSLLFSMIFSEICFVITLIFTISGFFGGFVLWLAFTILFFAIFLSSLIILEVQQANWNRKYRNLCEEIERIKIKIETDKKKLEILNE